MSVYDNMTFGLKLKKMPKKEIDERVKEVARILEIEAYLGRKLKELSGGQRQRVALGRAIIRDAKVLLFDEPLSNLDAKLQVQMRNVITKLHERIESTTIYVIHNQTEAMTMASRIVVMKDGYIQQIGTPSEIYNKPVNMFVAGCIGAPATNFTKGTIDENHFIYGNKKISLPEMFHSKLKEWDGKEVVLGIRPEDLYGEGIVAETYPSATFPFEVDISELLGHEYILYGASEGQALLANVSSHLQVKSHTSIELTMDLRKVHFFHPEDEMLIV